LLLTIEANDSFFVIIEAISKIELLSFSVQESIRRGYDDLAEHYLDCGELQSALKCFTR
jgi:hypothetical protein